MEDIANSVKMKRLNPMAVLHLSLCKAVGGWVPYEEFMSLPIGVITDLISTEVTMQDITKKGMKKVRKNV